MKRKFLYALGVLGLVSGSVFAGRESVKATPSNLYAKNIDGTGSCFAITTGTGNVSSNLDDNVNTGSGELQARIRSAGGTSYNIFAASDCTNDVKFL